MSFLYIDITSNDVNSGQYEVYINGLYLGIVIKNGSSWLASKPESKQYEDVIFSNKNDAAQYLAKLAGVS